MFYEVLEESGMGIVFFFVLLVLYKYITYRELGSYVPSMFKDKL